MSILSTNRKLIKVGQDYSAGSGISIDDHVISVTGEFGKTYSAGDNVDIYEQDEQLYISSKDWSDDIANASANAYNEATAQIPDPFDPSYLSAQIDNKLNSSDFTTWQNGQYSTDLQTIEGQINNKLYTSSFSDVSGSFLTAHQSLDGYATEDWVTAQGYITGVDLSPYYTTAEANSLSSMLSGAIDYVSANADNVEVTNVVQSNSGTWNEVSNKLDTTAFSDVSGSFITGVDLSDYYKKDETSGKEELAQAFSDIPVGDPEVNAYVTNNSAALDGTTDLVQNSSGLWNDVAVYQSNSANYLTAHQDISYKLDESAFSDVSGTFLTAINIPESASWEEATQAYEQNSGTYLTAHQSLEGYATEQWVGEQGYLTEVNIPESATWNEVSTTVQTNSSTWDSVSDKLDTTAFSDVSGTFLTAHQDLSDYQTTAGMVDYQTTAGMTAYQPVGDYYTTAEAETLSSMLSGAIDYVSANAGDEFPVSADEAIQYVQTNSAGIDDTVTSYQTNSGTFLTAHQAISAEEWNDCYDNVNTNSGAWGGDALPITGRDGIDLEIDNGTLYIGASALTGSIDYIETNSANIDEVVTNYQTASGTYLTAHQQISAGPGIDVQLVNDTLVFSAIPNETVLWSGDLTANSTANLSESWKNFEYIKIYGYSTPGGSMFGEGRTEDLVSAVDTGYEPAMWNPDICLNTVASWNHRSNFNIMVSMPLTFTADTNVSAMNGRLMGYWNDSWQFSDAEQRCHCTKIIGINRKQ